LVNILAIGTHFDDVEIGCGGTLLKYADEDTAIHIAVTNSDEARTGVASRRLSEQNVALEFLRLTLDDLRTFSCYDDAAQIVHTLDEIKPDIIFVPFESDYHQDHRYTSVIGQAVGRKKHITTFFYACGSTYDFDPNLFSIIDIESKEILLNCFTSQMEHGAVNLDVIKCRERYYGSLISDEPDVYAEGFVSRKLLLKENYYV